MGYFEIAAALGCRSRLGLEIDFGLDSQILGSTVKR